MIGNTCVIHNTFHIGFIVYFKVQRRCYGVYDVKCCIAHIFRQVSAVRSGIGHKFALV